MAVTILPPYASSSDNDSGDNSNSNDDDSASGSASARSSPMRQNPDSDPDSDPNSANRRPTTGNAAPRPRKRLKTSSRHKSHSSQPLSIARKTTSPHRILVPGDIITTEPQWMRGHGTYSHPPAPNSNSNNNNATANCITATLPGPLTITNKLLSITPLRTRYTPSIGDLVIGRITSLDRNRWRVDIGAPLLAQLPLSSINLPGGVLRRKTTADELQMRRFLREGEVVVAEVQGVGGVDGVAVLHTRSLRYGKLRNGVFLAVGGNGGGVVRGKRQVFTVDTTPAAGLASTATAGGYAGEVEVTLGVNGFIWIGRRVDDEHITAATATAAAAAAAAKTPTTTTTTAGGGGGNASTPSISNLDDLVSNAIYSSQNDEIVPATRLEIARLCSCITLLADAAVRIDESTVTKAYRAAVEAEMESEAMADADADADMMDRDEGGGGRVADSMRRGFGPGDGVDARRIIQAVLS